MKLVPVATSSRSPALGCQQNSFLWNVLTCEFKLTFNHSTFGRYKYGVHTVVACPRRLLEFVGGKRPQVKLDGVRRTLVGLDGRGHTTGFRA